MIMLLIGLITGAWLIMVLMLCLSYLNCYQVKPEEC